jgi:acyl-CoA thioester hydrolase
MHRLAVRIYYEDTDFSGVVYHANYLRYCERGRSDFLRLLGISHRELHKGEEAAERMGFAVKDMEIDFVKPARIDDIVEVHTRFSGLGRARFHLEQEIVREGDSLFTAKLTAVLVDGRGRPRRLPADMVEKFSAFAGSS